MQRRRPSLAVIRGWSRLGPSAHREIILGLILLLAYGSFVQHTGWNQNSRYDLVLALLDGTTQIDAYHRNTNDKAFHDGHYYSDKAPGTAIVGVPVHAVHRIAHRLVGAEPPVPDLAIQALASVEGGVFTALLVILLLRFLRPVVGERWALVISAGYGLGTIAFPFATIFFGHAPATFFLFAAFYLLWRARQDARGWRPIAAGLLAGAAVITEIPTVLGVGILGLYALWIGRTHAMRFILGGLPVLAVFMAYNAISFGGPFSVGYQFTTHFAEQNRQGIVSVVWPSLDRAHLLLFGPRGLVTLAPWFLAAPLGIIAGWRSTVRAELVVCVAMCLAFVAYNSGAINPMGGWTPGPRYLLPALPFAVCLVALAPTFLRIVIGFLVAVSVGIFSVATATLPAAPTDYREPLTELWIPRLVEGRFATTMAELRWGLDPGIALALILTAGLLGVAALAFTFRRGPRTEQWTALVALGLGVCVIAFAFPMWPL